MSTQLYDKDGKVLYPKINGDEIKVSWGDTEKLLPEILDSISELAQAGSGTSNIATSIVIESYYAIYNSSALETVKVDPSISWSSDFTAPTNEKPYAWKKVIIKVADKQQGETKYELIASIVQDKTQTIYKIQSNTQTPAPDESIYEQEDYQSDDFVPDGWVSFPKSVSASEPYLYISTRKKINGIWGKYTVPALLTNWSYESITKFYYAITPELTIPGYDDSAEDPNSHSVADGSWPYEWKSVIQEEFKGYLWMISATFVNNTLKGNWSTPTLIAIVK